MSIDAENGRKPVYNSIMSANRGERHARGLQKRHTICCGTACVTLIAAEHIGTINDKRSKEKGK